MNHVGDDSPHDLEHGCEALPLCLFSWWRAHLWSILTSIANGSNTSNKPYSLIWYIDNNPESKPTKLNWLSVNSTRGELFLHNLCLVITFYHTVSYLSPITFPLHPNIVSLKPINSESMSSNLLHSYWTWPIQSVDLLCKDCDFTVCYGFTKGYPVIN